MKKNRSAKIEIINRSDDVTVIDIEGIIGVPEDQQFSNPKRSIATYEKFRSRLEEIKTINSPQIIVNICSTGGNVNDALLIYDALTELNAKIVTRCYGYTASAATIIAQAASKGCREISANTLYLIHRSVCVAEGNRTDLVHSQSLLDKTDQRISQIYSKLSEREIRHFLELMDENNGNGKWLSAPEVIEAGLADIIISPEIHEKRNPSSKKFIGAIAQNLSKQLSAITKMVKTKQNSAMPESVHPKVSALNVNEIGKLQAKISMLESENARLSALPTMTEPKEDPTHHDRTRGANEQAYEKDLRSLFI